MTGFRCQKRKQQDEWFCARCELRWHEDDESPPKCKPLRKSKKRSKVSKA